MNTEKCLKVLKKCALIHTVWKEDIDYAIHRLSELEKEIEDRADTEQSLTNWVAKLGEEKDNLQAELKAIKEELEKTRVQFAGCGATALGYGKDCKKSDYGYSASLADVQRLYDKYVAMKERATKERIKYIINSNVIPMTVRSKDECYVNIDSLAKALEEMINGQSKNFIKQ